MRQQFLKFIGMLLAAWLLALPAIAAPKEVATQDDLNSQKEVFQLKIDQQKELLQKDIQAKDKEVTNFKERIAAQDTRISDIAWILTIFGVVVTAILGLLVYLGFVSVKVQVREQAKNWFDENSVSLKRQLDDLEKRVPEVKAAMDTALTQVQNHEGEVHVALEESRRAVSENRPISSKNKRIISNRADELKDKPKSAYTFDDWDTLAFSAFSKGNFELVLEYLNRALELKKISTLNRIRAMSNKGVTLVKLNRSKEAIAVYDIVIERFGKDKSHALRVPLATAMNDKSVILQQLDRHDEALTICNEVIARYEKYTELKMREHVATAMVNKGVTLTHLNHAPDALITYETVIEQYGQDKESVLREQVSKAMLNKGITLDQLDHSQEAIATYKAMIELYSKDKEVVLREQVAKAMNILGYEYLITAKACWQNQIDKTRELTAAIAMFNEAFERLPNSAMVIANQAYAAWLNGEFELAEKKFKAALSAPNSGGDEIYQGTLDDLDIHPVDADAGFKELIDHLWSAYQNK